MPNQSIAENFLAYAVQRMQLSERDIRRCCDQLTEEQIWQRDGEHENAVGNLLLHLEGNIRQWILHGVDGQPDIRQRDDEFALAPAVSSTDARAQLAATIDEACTVIATLAPERLLEGHRPAAQRHLAARDDPGGHRQGLRSSGDAHRAGHPADQADGGTRSRSLHAAQAVAVGFSALSTVRMVYSYAIRRQDTQR